MGIDLDHHATILHSRSCRKARNEAAQLTATHRETANTVSATREGWTPRNPALERSGCGARAESAREASQQEIENENAERPDFSKWKELVRTLATRRTCRRERPV